MAGALSLRPMTAAEYSDFMARHLAEYARDRSTADAVPIERARDFAAEQIGTVLPQGAATPGHRFLAIVVSGEPEPAGDLWLLLVERDEDRRVYLMQITLRERWRGRGLGREAMALVEREAASLGAWAVELHVFGHNDRARNLYASLGYESFSVNMRKAVGPRPG